MTTITSALVVTESEFSDGKRLAVAGSLASYSGMTRDAHLLDLRQSAPVHPVNHHRWVACQDPAHEPHPTGLKVGRAARIKGHLALRSTGPAVPLWANPASSGAKVVVICRVPHRPVARRGVPSKAQRSGKGSDAACSGSRPGC